MLQCPLSITRSPLPEVHWAQATAPFAYRISHIAYRVSHSAYHISLIAYRINQYRVHSDPIVTPQPLTARLPRVYLQSCNHNAKRLYFMDRDPDRGLSLHPVARQTY